MSEDGNQIFITNEFVTYDGHLRVEVKVWDSSDLLEHTKEANYSMKSVNELMRVKVNPEEKSDKIIQKVSINGIEEKLNFDEMIRDEQILWKEEKKLVFGCHSTKYIHNLQLLANGQYLAFYLRKRQGDGIEFSTLE